MSTITDEGLTSVHVVTLTEGGFLEVDGERRTRALTPWPIAFLALACAAQSADPALPSFADDAAPDVPAPAVLSTTGVAGNAAPALPPSGAAGAPAADDTEPPRAPTQPELPGPDPTVVPTSTVSQGAAGTFVEHPVEDTVRFIAIGDTGTGEPEQFEIAQVMADVCASDGCDFVVMLGDNLYDEGPVSLQDPQWDLKFEQPYAALDIPFYVVLGNHDVAAEPLFGSGYVPEQSVLEVEYTQQSSKWMMPAPHYAIDAGPVGLLMIDTTSLYNHITTAGDQHQWIGPARDALSSKHSWVLSAGHHTYASNGSHGNAGAYAYFDFDPGLEIKQFFDTNLCGQIDLVLTGHDHNRQWLDASTCAGTEVIVSGAGAKVSALSGTNPTHWQSAELGFLYVIATADTLTGRFIGSKATIEFERTLTK